MIDIEIDFFDELARLVLAEYPEAYVSNEYERVPSQFPAVFILESNNTEERSTVSTFEGEEAVALTYEVQVAHPSAKRGKAVCKEIVRIVSDRMRERNMSRTMCMPVDNAEDPSVFRMIARYTGIVDRFGTHFRR
ncbi:MAG: hypothetical protein J6D54_03905 [Olsenella sp.]|nr:hypothetical protein [Olsenella sp.]